MEIFTFCVFLFVGLYLLGRYAKKYNKTDWGHPLINVLDGLNYLFCRFFHRMPDSFIELPNGPVIIISNHVSGLDPLCLIAMTKRPLRFMIAQEEYDRWGLTWLLKIIGCIPVQRDKNPKRAFSNSLAALENDQVLVIFPEGGIVARTGDKPLKKGAFRLAALSQAPIKVVRIEGVKAKGYTHVAIFIPSKIRIIQYSDVINVKTALIGEAMSKALGFFTASTREKSKFGVELN